jgi:nitrite reductase/ring-hydroxylating ferredoxin subunit
MQTIELSFSSLASGSVHQVQHAGAKLIVVRREDGRVFAFHDKCPHAFWPLSEGTLRNSVLECPGHGWEFDLETGRCLTAPVYCLTAVHVTREGDSLRLEWSDDLAAAPARAPQTTCALAGEAPNFCPNDFPAVSLEVPLVAPVPVNSSAGKLIPRPAPRAASA